MSEILRNRRIATLGLVLTLGANALACGKEDRVTEATPTPPPKAAETPIAELSQLVFDDLGGGSSIIRVFPGVENEAADKIANGTFNDGDTVPAECKTDGRMVHSDTNAGEENRELNDWIKIQGTPGEEQYATAVYVENPGKLLSQLEDC